MSSPSPVTATRSPATRSPAPRLFLWPKRLLYLLYAGVALWLAADWGLTQTAALALVLFPLAAVDFALRGAVERQFKQLDRELTRLVQQGSMGALHPTYRAHRLVRLAGAHHETMRRLGAIHTWLKEHEAAAVALHEALDEAPLRDKPAMAKQLGDCYYALGDTHRAEHHYRLSQNEQSVDAGVRARVARLIVERNGDRAEAERWLREAVSAGAGSAECGVLRCQLVEMLAGTGQLEEAQWQLQIAEEELATATPDHRALLDAARRAVAPS